MNPLNGRPVHHQPQVYHLFEPAHKLDAFFRPAYWNWTRDSSHTKTADDYFLKLNPTKAPEPGPLLLKKDDRLAIIGDSITEQKMYSRIIETYLTVCVPELKITTRQYGWSGETAESFLHRMTNDCLRFQPTVATLCYGMNDHRYRPFDEANAAWYRNNYLEVVRDLEDSGARVVVGSPGCIDKMPPWASNIYTIDELNANLCAFRDIDIQIAAATNERFADIFWTMFKAVHEGQIKFGTPDKPYMLSGKDGVHPGWAGHLVMAYVFLRAMGLDGDIGTLTVDLNNQTATATTGHTVESFTNNDLIIISTKYPFCATGETNSDDSIRSGAMLVPFFQDLSRFRLVVTHAKAANYYVIWGTTTNTYSATQLAAGVNIAADFAENPFCNAFKKVDEAVAAKQDYETKQVQQIFHGDEGKADITKAVEHSEAERALLVAAIKNAMTPVRHTIRIESIQ